MISIPGSGGLHESENAEIKPLSGRLSAIGCCTVLGKVHWDGPVHLAFCSAEWWYTEHWTSGDLSPNVLASMCSSACTTSLSDAS